MRQSDYSSRDAPLEEPNSSGPPVLTLNNHQPSDMDAPQRKRVKNACFSCHTRKVRCDSNSRGIPCTNCQEDGTAHLCKPHVRKSRRSSGSAAQTHPGKVPTPHNATVTQMMSIAPGPARLLPETVSSFPSNRQPLDEFSASSNMSHSMLPGPFPMLEADFSDFAGLDSIFDVNTDMAMDSQGMWDFSPNIHTQLPINVASPAISWTTPPSNSHLLHTAPVEDQDQTERTFLKSQGCFTLPKSSTLCRLMTSYFRHVHPNLPLVNEADFWRLWPQLSDDNFRLGSFSILVLQAMCFAAASFASEDLLRQCGFRDGDAAREGLYRRAKLLFDFGYEPSFVACSQAALILSYHVPKKDVQRKNTQWLIHGIFFARLARADRYYSAANVAKGTKHVKTLKRLWWCCILRDRILPLGLRRPCQITQIEPEVDFLSEADFADELGESRVHPDRETQAQIFRIVRLTCKLTHLLTRPMRAMFTIESFEERAKLSSEALSLQMTKIEDWMKQLRLWHEEANEIFPSPISLGDTHETVTTLANMLFIYYEAAILGLCQYKMLLSEARNPAAAFINFETPIEDISGAVERTTDRVRELVQLNLIHGCPISLTAYLSFPVLLQAISAKAAAGTQGERTARRQLEVYLRAMRHQQKIYDASEFASSVVDKILAYAIDEQMLTAGAGESQQQKAELGPARTSVSVAGYGMIRSWRDLLQQKPRFYLRLALQIDRSLSTGRPPDEEDFPPQLRRQRSGGLHTGKPISAKDIA